MSVGDIDGISRATFDSEYRELANLRKKLESNNISSSERKEVERRIDALQRRVNPPPPR